MKNQPQKEGIEGEGTYKQRDVHRTWGEGKGRVLEEGTGCLPERLMGTFV